MNKLLNLVTIYLIILVHLLLFSSRVMSGSNQTSMLRINRIRIDEKIPTQLFKLEPVSIPINSNSTFSIFIFKNLELKRRNKKEKSL